MTAPSNELCKSGINLDVLNFAVFPHGRYDQDYGARGKVVDFRVRFEIGRNRIEAGDILFGDIDGVLVVPQRVEKDTISRNLEKVCKENFVKKALGEGMSTFEAFRTYGVM